MYSAHCTYIINIQCYYVSFIGVRALYCYSTILWQHFSLGYRLEYVLGYDLGLWLEYGYGLGLVAV